MHLVMLSEFNGRIGGHFELFMVGCWNLVCLEGLVLVASGVCILSNCANVFIDIAQMVNTKK